MLFEISALPDIFEYTSLSYDREDALDSFLFHVCENGLLLDLGNGLWSSHLSQMQLPQSLRDLTIAYMKKLWDTHRIIGCPNKKAIEEKYDWLELSKDAHNVKALSAIVTSISVAEQIERSLPIISFPPNRSPFWNSKIRGRMTQNIEKNETGFKGILDPILRYARKVVIVDPFLNCSWKKYKKNLWIISELLGNFRDGKYCGEIEIQTSLKAKYPRSKAEIKKLWTTEIEPLKEKFGHKYFIKILEANKKLLEPHNRFLFTDQCGVRTGYGMDCYDDKDAAIDEWTLLDYSSWKINEARFGADPEFTNYYVFEVK